MCNVRRRSAVALRVGLIVGGLSSAASGQCLVDLIRLGEGDSSDFGLTLAVTDDSLITGNFISSVYGDPAFPLPFAPGSAVIYQRHAGKWIEDTRVWAADWQHSDHFGDAVAIAAPYAVVGALSHDIPCCGVLTEGSGVGAAYVFERTPRGWKQMARLTASDGDRADHLGWGVAISGTTVAAGAPLADADGDPYGAVYIYELEDGLSGPHWVETQKVFTHNLSGLPQFGMSLLLQDDVLVVGAPTDWLTEPRSGSVFVFRRDGGTWVEEARLVASDPLRGAKFGESLALHGDTLVVGAREHDGLGEHSGAAYIFERSAGTWSQSAKLVAGDPREFANFGWAVATNGDVVAVGAPHQQASVLPHDSAVYVYRRQDDWVQWARLSPFDADEFVPVSTEFGNSLGMSGDELYVGDHNSLSGFEKLYVYAVSGDCNLNRLIDACETLEGTAEDCNENRIPDWCETDCNENGVVDACEIFEGDRTDCDLDRSPDECGASTAAACNQFLTAPACQIDKLGLLESDMLFGWSVAMTDEFAAVGALNTSTRIEGNPEGSVWMYRREGEAWHEVWDDSDSRALVFGVGRTGASLDLEDDVLTIAMPGNSRDEDDEAVIVQGPEWFAQQAATQQIELSYSFTDANPFDQIGLGVAVAASAETVLIGLRRGWDNGRDSGAVHVIERGDGSWSESGVLVPADGGPDDWFGQSVDIEGDVAIVGAFRKDDATAGDDAGAVYVFHRLGAQWVEGAKLIPSDLQAYDAFGWSVALSGNYAVIGAYMNDDACSGDPYCDSGSAYVFERTGTSSWNQVAKLTAYDGRPGDWFGRAVAIDGDRVVVGAERADVGGLESNSGAAYLFVREGDTWIDHGRFLPSDQTLWGQFGKSVAIRGDQVMIGAPGGDYQGVRRPGAVYAFTLHLDGVDCDGDGLSDVCGIDCNENGVTDLCEIEPVGTLADCNTDSVPDECQLAGNDCNWNLIPDDCELPPLGSLPDCNLDLVPDECQLTANDCNANVIPDDCEVPPLGLLLDCNQDLVPDECQLSGNDCNANAIPDECDVPPIGLLLDCNTDLVPDECQLSGNDCNANAIPDDCDIPPVGSLPDCNRDRIPDECQLTGNDCNANAIPDECEPDDDGNGIPNGCCAAHSECIDPDPCTFDLCSGTVCTNTPATYGDVAGIGSTCGPDGMVDLADILAVLDGFGGVFATGCEVSNVDIASQADGCAPDGVIDLSDILAVLDAFQGTTTCCPGE